MTVKRWEVLPDQVTVDGPEEEVSALKEVLAGPISVDEEVGNVVRTAKLRTGVLGVQVVDLHEAEVRVEIAAPLLDRAVAKGYTAGINYEARQILVDAWKADIAAANDKVPGAKASGPTGRVDPRIARRKQAGGR